MRPAARATVPVRAARACAGALLLLLAIPARGAPPPLRFADPTPRPASRIAAATVPLRIDAPCGTDPASLRLELDGVELDGAALLPFGACGGGRMLSQVGTIPLAPPDGTIVAGAARARVGETVIFAGAGDGATLAWSFAGGAPPALGTTVEARFRAAGRFAVELQAFRTHTLSVRAALGGRVLRAERRLESGDPTPDVRHVDVEVPPDVDFVNFETSQVHPLALAGDRSRLFALDTPGGRLEVLDVAGDGTLRHAASIPVGLEPASLAVRPGTDEVWVVNQLSDSVSVVDVARQVVVATVATADEPSDVAFAGGRAFVAAGGRDDVVRVYDAATRAEIASVPLFGDGPRALATSPDGSRVYAIVHRSGNRTTILSPSGTGVPEGPPIPTRHPDLPPQWPFSGFVVQFDPASGEWRDETGVRRGFVPIVLPDHDLFVIDALGPPAVVSTVRGVGTSLFDLAVHPTTGEVWVANTEAHNVRRFLAALAGRFADTRVSLVDVASGAVQAVDLNPHVDGTVPAGPPEDAALAIAQPGAGAFTADGARFYLTAFGSRKVAVLDPDAAVTDLIDVGAGPSGVALDEARGRLYCLNRFEQTISVIDVAAGLEVARTPLGGPAGFDPSPAAVTRGRETFYDARTTSGHGDLSCATCHPAGGADGLAWDLGDPQGVFLPYADAPWVRFFLIPPRNAGFDPMKGPMTTQTLRGVRDGAPYHWRGDRPDLHAFNASFVEILGRPSELPAADMDALVAFLDTLRFPPNPFRLLDDGLPAAIGVPTTTGVPGVGDPRRGETIFLTGRATAGVIDCDDCHALPTGTSDKIVNLNAPQEINTPQLRNLHEKLDYELFFREQKRGFGVLSDGGAPLAQFLSSNLFALSPQDERDMLAFLLAFPGDVAPAVGHQVTADVASAEDPGALARIGTLLDQAALGACDVIVKGVAGGVARGWVFDPVRLRFVPDDDARSAPSLAELLGALAGEDVVTFTGVPHGSGARLGVDRDRDGFRDATEAALGFDAADPTSNPWAPGATSAPCRAAKLAFSELEIRVEALRAPLGRQRLRLRAGLTLDAGQELEQGLDLDPMRDGLQVLIEDLGAGEARILDLTEPRSVPGGPIGDGCDARGDGWSARGRDFRYRNRSGRLAAPACAADALGLRSIRVTDHRPRAPRLDVVLQARGAALEMPVGPLRATVVLGAALDAGTSGACAVAELTAERCLASGGGSRFVCR